MNRAMLIPGLLLALTLQARGAEQTESSVYRNAMQAQYAARGAPRPATPQEAERIYEIYLQSRGQASKDRVPNSGTDAGNPSH